MRGLAGLALALVIAFCIAPGPALACVPPADKAAGQATDEILPETGRVVRVIDGDTLVLADATEVRLVGIQAPKLPLGRRDFPTWPLAPEAKAALEALALGAMVRLFPAMTARDRHGRVLAQLYRADALNAEGLPDAEATGWLQGAMVEAGLARVYTFADNRACAAPLLARERAARAAKRGLWALPFYAIRTPDGVGRDLGTFQLVEGRVVAVARVRGRAYLNFGADWRSDFTVAISPKDLRIFDGEGYDLDGLMGARIRVRGWLSKRNGPMIEATHPEQIEKLGDEDQASTR